MLFAGAFLAGPGLLSAAESGAPGVAGGATVPAAGPVRAMATGPKSMAQPPNIVFIMTDQHNADFLGCLGRTELRTPHLDALAGQSAVFRSAYSASPVCGPARGAVLTGQYPVASGICGNWIPVKDEASLLTGRLAQAGYFNAMIGKLHLSPVRDTHGFDFRRMCDSPHDVYDKEEIVVNDYLPWAAKGMGITPERLAVLAGESERCGVKDPRFWQGWSWADDAHQMTTWTGNEATAFIHEYKQEKPFFLHVSFFGPHHPYATCEPWDSMYDPAKVTLPPTFGQVQPGKQRGFRPDGWSETQWREMIAKYSGNISAIDLQIGRIAAALKERGMWDNTLIVFTADHGDHMGDFSQLGKGTMLESSVRVPFLIKPPRPAPKKQERTEVVNLIDLYPTFLDYAGSAAAGIKAPVRSLRRVLEGDGVWQNQTFASLCAADGRKGTVMMIKHKFKAVEFLVDGKMTVELYDRTAPLPDSRNLAGDPAFASVVKEMQTALEVWLAGGCSVEK
jgi:arylsulfatase A-like enzyme